MPTEIKLSVFPVPASTDLHVTFVSPVADNLTISIVSMLGKVVYTNDNGRIPAGNYSTGFSVAGLLPGNYVLRLQLGTKVYTAKIIVIK